MFFLTLCCPHTRINVQSNHTIRCKCVRIAISYSASLLIVSLTAVLNRLPKMLRFGSDLHDVASPGTSLFDLRAAKQLSEGAVPLHHAASHPGLAVSAAVAHRLLSVLGLSVDLKDVCAVIAPMSAAISCVVIYFLGMEISGDSSVGMLSAELLALLPASTAATVAGSFGAQGLAVSPLLVSILYYLRAIKQNRPRDSAACAAVAGVSLLLTSLTCRAYSLFLSYLFPLHVAYMLCTGKHSANVWATYTTLYSVGRNSEKSAL